MVALQLPAAIDFRFERTRFPSQTRKSAFEYPNDQRALLLPSNRSSFNGVLLSSKEGSFPIPMIHRTERNGVSSNSTSANFKIVMLPNQSTSTIDPLEFNEAIETLALIPSNFLPESFGVTSIHFEVVSAYQLNAGRAHSIVPTSSPSQHDPCAEIDSLMPEGQHHRVNCRIIFDALPKSPFRPLIPLK